METFESRGELAAARRYFHDKGMRYVASIDCWVGMDMAKGVDKTVYAVPAGAEFMGTDRELRLRYGIPEHAAILRLKPRSPDIADCREQASFARPGDSIMDSHGGGKTIGEAAAEIERLRRDDTSPAEADAAERESLQYQVLKLENEMLRRYEQIRIDIQTGMQTLASQLGAMVHGVVQTSAQGDESIREQVNAESALRTQSIEALRSELATTRQLFGEIVISTDPGRGWQKGTPSLLERVDGIGGRLAECEIRLNLAKIPHAKSQSPATGG